MILKRDGDRRVHERPHKMLEDDDYDKKKLLSIILEIVYRNYNFQDRKVLIQGSESVQKAAIYGA